MMIGGPTSLYEFFFQINYGKGMLDEENRFVFNTTKLEAMMAHEFV